MRKSASRETESLAEYVHRLVDDMPPFDEETREELRQILGHIQFRGAAKRLAQGQGPGDQGGSSVRVTRPDDASLL